MCIRDRSNQTHQDRLVKELRLLGINEIEAANAYLPTYLLEHNNRFAVEAHSKEDAHQKECPTNDVLDLIFSYQDDRTLSKNLELSYDNVIYQIQTNWTLAFFNPNTPRSVRPEEARNRSLSLCTETQRAVSKGSSMLH